MNTIRNMVFVTLVLTLSSCGGVFQSVRVKSSPTVRVPAGTRAFSLSEFWDVDEFLADMQELPGLEVVRVDPNDPASDPVTPLTFRLRQDILDVSQEDLFTETIDLGDLSQTIDPVSFSVPEVTFAGESISQNIDPIPLPNEVSLAGLNQSGIPEGDGTFSVDAVPLAINSEGYDSITFNDGQLTLNASIAGGSSGLAISYSTVEIRDASDSSVILSASTVPQSVTVPLVFDMAGVTLPADIELNIGLQGENGNLGSFFDISFNMDLTGNLSGAEGIDFATTFEDTVEIPLVTPDELVSATVGTGAVDVELAFPAEWTGVTTTMSLELLQGGTVLTQASGPVPLTLNLAGVSLGAGDLSLNYSIDVTGTAATFALDPDAVEVTGDVAAEITNFSSLVVDGSNLVVAIDPISVPVDGTLKEFVTAVGFSSHAMSLTFENRLPADLTLTLDSTAFGVNSQSNTFSTLAPADDPEVWTVNLANNLDISALTEIDFAVDYSLSGYDDVSGNLTLNNVAPGASYSFGGSIAVDLVVETVTLNSGASYDGTFPPDDGDYLDLSMLGDYLPAEVQFENVRAPLDLDFTGVTGGLDLWIQARWNGGVDTLDLVGTEAVPASIDATSPDVTIDLDAVLNARPSDLRFNFYMAANGLTVGGADPLRLLAALLVDIPLALNVSGTEPVLLDFSDDNGDNPLAMTEDLFGRTEGEENEQLDILFEAVQGISLNMNVVNNLGVNLIVRIVAGDFSKQLDFSTGTKTLALNAADVELIKNTIPFAPEIQFLLPAGAQAFDYNGDITFSLWAQVDSQLDYAFSTSGN